MSFETLSSEIAEALSQNGRMPDDASLLAVSKRQSIEDIRALATLGQRAFGENLVQEALSKIEALSELDLQWHFIGSLQSNKTRLIAEHFDWVQSVDREKLIQRLNDQRPGDLEPLNICIQINLDGEKSKGGADPDQAGLLARLVTDAPRLRLRGLMSIPRPTEDVAQQRDQFRQVRVLFDQLKADGLDMDTLSMGMSGDWPAAIAEGATLLRIGTALFGARS